jgi:N-acyl-L-homoserine lactone synthetase
MTGSSTPSPLVIVRVAEPEDQEAIERCRFEVYGSEGFIDPTDYPDGRESDHYDAYSQAVVATVGPDAKVVGTSRLILGSGGILPVQDPRHHNLDISSFGNVAEISRLCVRSEHQDGRISLGLYRCLFHLLDVHNIDTVLAVVDEAFFDTLCWIGFPFSKVGPVRDHMGLTVPCACRTAEVLPALRSNENSRALSVDVLFEQPFTGQIIV